ncbi:hypothetical protein UlMin_031941 [Ulmus minor]
MDSIQTKVELWIKEQRAKIMKVSWGPLQWRLRWPWNGGDREQRKRLQEEFDSRRKQLRDLCRAFKADSVSDLQEILCCMVLSECVYKRPSAELVRAVNRFKADFGGQVVSLERVQPSSDHVPHRYLLAEAGDTLFASFIGTKQYKDVVTDANIFQGAIFHEDAIEDIDGTETNKSDQTESRKGNVESMWNPLESKSKQLKDNSKPKPAAHRGFMSRAKGIPALDLYRLAQKKKRKLVLCGHSLGGAVAALATLAILRVIAASSSLKENENVQVKCITFSQPPVGNAALRDYVNRKGWEHHFKSYCIPEDLVPRLLSPAYFHHYNAQPLSMPEAVDKLKENEGEQLVLGVGPVQNSIWRLSKLVPLDSVRRQLNKYRGKKVDSVGTLSVLDSAATALVEDEVVETPSLEIQENSDGISLKPISDTSKELPNLATNGKFPQKNANENGEGRKWRRMPYLPSYVPFGQLYLLENSSVQSLSDAEYSKLTSVRSVIAELRERFQSHSMRSYRSRFQRIFDMCMRDYSSSFIGIEQLQQLPHLQHWLGFAVAETVELGHIVESPVIRTATSIVPLGWSGVPGEKNGEPLKVDITGFGLHLCNLIHAQVNGKWCSTIVESFPSAPMFGVQVQQELQKMRVSVGAPLNRAPIQIAPDSFMHVLPSIDSEGTSSNREINSGSSYEETSTRPDGLSDFFVFCTSDFTTVTKEVHVRTRRVQLLGLEGAGKTSLFKAILNEGRITTITNIENLLPEPDVQESIAGGLRYYDSAGVNLQELSMAVSHFKDELWTGIRDLNRKTDLIVLVHNLSHRVPHYSNASEQRPVLSFLLDEAKSLGIPWILAITNKFSVSAHQQKAAIDAVLQAYQASPSTTGVVNSCPYVMHSAGNASLSWGDTSGNSDNRMGAQSLIYAPIKFVQRPFQKKETILPVEGINSLRQVVHRVLKTQEEASFEELARERLLMVLARERAVAMGANGDSGKANTLSAAAAGASFGAGLGVLMALIMGAASALRKP